MIINDKVNFYVIKGENKDKKEYYALQIEVCGIKKIIAFLTETQYRLISTTF